MLRPKVHDTERFIFLGQKARQLSRMGDGCGVCMRVKFNANIQFHCCVGFHWFVLVCLGDGIKIHNARNRARYILTFIAFKS